MHNKNVNALLQEHLRYLAERSPFYRDLFKKNDIKIENIQVGNLSEIPTTSKKDLQENNRAFVCVLAEELIEHSSTSGTSGKPVTISLTDKDLERLALNECNSFKIAGIDKGDLIQLMTTVDRRFMAGLAYFLGARKLGAGIIRVGNGLPELQWDNILSLKPDVLICVPSFLLKLIRFAEEKNIDYRNCSVKKAVCIGEVIRNQDFSLNNLGKKINEKWDLELFTTYASTEMGTAFTECSAHCGLHQQDDLIITEIINDEGQPVADGEAGELVVTPLGIEGMPLLRFRTGDIMTSQEGICVCGRSGRRLGPLLGRKEQMIKYKGTSLYPNAIYDVLEQQAGVENFQVEISSNELGTDEVTIYIGINEKSNISLEELTDIFRSRLRVVPRIILRTPQEIGKMLFPGANRKPMLFIDRRTD